MKIHEFDAQPELQRSAATETVASAQKEPVPVGALQRSSQAQAILQLQRTHGNRYVQRMVALARKGEGEFDPGPEVESAVQSTRGNGQALDHGVRTQMETAFSADFSGVRVHTNTQADTLNRAVNARAFTTGKDIFFRDGEYSPGSSSGQKLLAHELTHVVQQTGPGIRPKLVVNAPGDVYEQEADLVAEHVTRVQASSSSGQPMQRTEGPRIGSRSPAISRAVANVRQVPNASSGPKSFPMQVLVVPDTEMPESSATSEEAAIAVVEPSAEKDPRFQGVLNKLDTSAKKTKRHPHPSKKVKEAQAAAEPPKNAKIAGAKLVKMKAVGSTVQNQQPDNMAPESFLDVLSKAIDEVMPKGSDNAENFLEAGGQARLKNTMTGQFDRQKQDATQPLRDAQSQQLDPGGVKESTPALGENRDLVREKKEIPPEPAPNLPHDIGAAEAMPQPKPDAQVSLEKNKQEANQALTDRNITEEQLREANDPRFTQVLTAKAEVEKDADSAPARYRAKEKVALVDAIGQARTDEKQGLLGFASQRSHSTAVVKTEQLKAADHDTDARQKTVNDIEDKYKSVESKVKTELDPLDKQVPQMFDHGVGLAISNMKTNIRVNLERYKEERHGFSLGGIVRFWKDIVLTLDDDRVKQIYQDGRNVFKNVMVKTFKEIIDFVEARLQAARKAIADGEKEIDHYVETQKTPELKRVAEMARKDISGRFAQLRRSIEEKKNTLAQKLAQSYKDAIGKANAALEEIRKENRGLLNKVYDKAKEVYEILRQIKDKLLSILKQALDVIELIIKHPIRFVENLIEAVSQGFNKFRDRAIEYIEEALLAWLVGPLSEKGIQLPKDLSLPSILSLVLQVLGLDLPRLQQKAQKYALVRNLPMIEKALELIKMLWDRGPAALWEEFKDYLGDLKDQVIGAIKDWLIAQIVKEGIKILLSMFTFAGGIIKAAQAIYDIIMFFVDNWHTIERIVSAVFGSITDIVNGRISAASDRIVQAIRWGIHVVINFLARLLHLTGISEAVTGFIHKIRTKVDKAVDWLMEKVFGKVGKLLGGERAQALFERVAGGTPEERLDKALVAGQAVLDRFAGRAVGVLVLRPLLGAIRLRYQLQWLEPVDDGGYWALEGLVNPRKRSKRSRAQVAGEGEGSISSAQTPIGASQDFQKQLETIEPRIEMSYPSHGTLSRPEGPSGHVKGVKEEEERESLAGTGLGYQPGDHRGHLIGDRFYGPSILNNLVPMHRTLNLSTFKRYENRLAKEFKKLKNTNRPVLLFLHVKPLYLSDNPGSPLSYRPQKIVANSKIITLRSLVPTPAKEEIKIDSGEFSNPSPEMTVVNINTADETTLRSFRLDPRLITALLRERQEGPYRSLDGLKLRLFPRLGDLSNLLSQLDAIGNQLQF